MKENGDDVDSFDSGCTDSLFSECEDEETPTAERVLRLFGFSQPPHPVPIFIPRTPDSYFEDDSEVETPLIIEEEEEEESSRFPHLLSQMLRRFASFHSTAVNLFSTDEDRIRRHSAPELSTPYRDHWVVRNLYSPSEDLQSVPSVNPSFSSPNARIQSAPVNIPRPNSPYEDGHRLRLSVPANLSPSIRGASLQDYFLYGSAF